jgi:phosphatidylglycerophosphate synthase
VIIIISREFIVSGLRMVAVVEDIVIAASNLGKWKTVFQMIAIVAFILKDTQTIQSLPEPLPMVLNIGSWIVMGLAVILTIWSGVDYLYNAREVLTGPWTSKETSQPEEG